MIPEADHIIEKFNLIEHPEGGYFTEKFRSHEKINKGLPERFQGGHSLYTSIYFLLKGNDISAFHILKSDEIWHFYEGTTLLIHTILNDGFVNTVRLGRKYNKDDVFQHLIKAGTYFCAEVEDKSSYSFVGCTVSPGFEYSDFTLCKRNELLNLYPQNKDLILKFTSE
jgi:predicted cupin superfamily sugar epimerase